MVENAVVISVGSKMSSGALLPNATRIPMIDVGIS